uniref:Transmembrane protein 201 n=1 Tax=Nothobranchius kadleci TaxID=1051664 RepID=A0A1A8EHJ2_NOTKA
METFNMLLFEYPELMYSGFGATAVFAGGALVYKIATRKKPTHASVNCWFCNQNTVVPYGNRNCWDCPNCDQYNGFQENGDYNKPIPAQYMEHLNHGVSGSPQSETPKSLQWVNCQMLLCRKCNNNQSTKIKQLASYIPRDDENYDEEIEAFKHHLEQTFKLCRPCQTAVEYYIKYQNRQLRTVLLNHQLRRTRESDSGFVKSSHSLSSPVGVIMLRVLAFLLCAFVLATSFCDFPQQPVSPSGPQTLSGGVTPPNPTSNNATSPNNNISAALLVWQGVLEVLPDRVIENAQIVWQHGKNNQLVTVSAGLLACLTAIFLAGPTRLRRIDVVASVLWFFTLCLYLSESYLTNTFSWMDTVKLITVSLCCLVSFAAAAATRKSLGPRRARHRRYLLGSSAAPPFSCQPPLLTPNMAASFFPSPPPNLPKRISRQHEPREHKASPSTLPGRLSRVLCLGTAPSLTRTDSGYLFSGSKPASLYKDSTSSDYFSMNSWSRPSSPGPSPTPSVAGSVTSSSGSARQRRPLISPARLNISRQKHRLFSREPEPKLMSPPLSPFPFYVEPALSVYSGCVSQDVSPFQSQNDLSSLTRGRRVIEEEEEKRSCSSESSACLVGTTTQSPEAFTPPRGFVKRLIWAGLLFVSLTSNLLFACFFVYHRSR